MRWPRPAPTSTRARPCSRRRCSSSRAAAARIRRFPRGGWTALMFAARQGAIDSGRALAELGANLERWWRCRKPTCRSKATNSTSVDKGVGTTALVFAIINSHYDLAAMLLDKGADPNVADLSGMARALRGRGHEQPAVDAGPARPDPHRHPGRDRPGAEAAGQGRQPERAAEAGRCSSAITTPASTLNSGRARRR